MNSMPYEREQKKAQPTMDVKVCEIELVKSRTN